MGDLEGLESTWSYLHVTGTRLNRYYVLKSAPGCQKVTHMYWISFVSLYQVCTGAYRYPPDPQNRSKETILTLAKIGCGAFLKKGMV